MQITSPKILIAVGIIYLLNPFDIPGPVDDLIVNVVLCSLAFFFSRKNNVVDGEATITPAPEELQEEVSREVSRPTEVVNRTEVKKCDEGITTRSSSF